METNTFFKEALSCIGKQVKMPEKYASFIDRKFSKISFGKRFLIEGVVGQENEEVKTLRFEEPKDTENFKGIEFSSEKLYIIDNSIPKQFFGNFIITYHRDLDKWTICLRVYSMDDENFDLISFNDEIIVV